MSKKYVECGEWYPYFYLTEDEDWDDEIKLTPAEYGEYVTCRKEFMHWQERFRKVYDAEPEKEPAPERIATGSRFCPITGDDIPTDAIGDVPTTQKKKNE